MTKTGNSSSTTTRSFHARTTRNCAERFVEIGLFDASPHAAGRICCCCAAGPALTQHLMLGERGLCYVWLVAEDDNWGGTETEQVSGQD